MEIKQNDIVSQADPRSLAASWKGTVLDVLQASNSEGITEKYAKVRWDEFNQAKKPSWASSEAINQFRYLVQDLIIVVSATPSEPITEPTLVEPNPVPAV